MTTHAKTNLLPVHVYDGDEWSTGTKLSAKIDTQGFRHLLLLMSLGVAVGTLATAVTECDTEDGTYTPALDDDGVAIAFPAVSSANDQALLAGLLRTDRRKRWIQLSGVVATDVVNFAGAGLLLNPDHTQRVTDGYTLAFEV